MWFIFGLKFRFFDYIMCYYMVFFMFWNENNDLFYFKDYCVENKSVVKGCYGSKSVGGRLFY